jgi:hypothetical protein
VSVADRIAPALGLVSGWLLFWLVVPAVDLHFIVWLFDLDARLALPLVVWGSVATWGVVGRLQGDVIDARSQALFVVIFRLVVYPWVCLQVWAITALTGI